MRFTTPDHALRATVEIYEQCSSVQAMNPVAQEGTRFARECAKCGAKPYRVKHDRDGVPFALCRHCGKDRHREDVYLLRESGKGGGDVARALCTLADLERVIRLADRRGRGIFRTYSVVVLSPWPLWQVRDFCSGKKWGPGLGGGFTDRTLRRAIRDGRAELARSLHRSNMLEGDLAAWTDTPGDYGRRFA